MTKAKSTSKQASKSTARKPGAKKTEEHLPYATEDPAEAYEHYTDAAREAALGPDPENYNADLNVVPRNVEEAVPAIDPHLGRADVTPETRRVVRELPALVLALIYADSRVTQERSTGAIAEAQAVMRPLRQLGLTYLEVASSDQLGLVPAERVRKLREGRGPEDEARDGIGIAGVFKEFATALAGKHPFTAVQLATLEAKSVFLVRALKPAGAAPELDPKERDDSTLVRDGLWTLIVRAYDELLGVATKVWGFRRVNDHVPALLARAGASAAEKKGAGEPEKKGGEVTNGGAKPVAPTPAK